MQEEETGMFRRPAEGPETGWAMGAAGRDGTPRDDANATRDRRDSGPRRQLGLGRCVRRCRSRPSKDGASLALELDATSGTSHPFCLSLSKHGEQKRPGKTRPDRV